MFKLVLAILSILLISSNTHGGKFDLVDKGLSGLSTPEDAVSMVVADISTISETDRIFYRYIWIPQPEYSKIAAVNYTVNIACSKSVVIVKPEVLFGGELLRWDLRKLAPEPKQTEKLMEIWENFQFEPYFHITKDSKDALPTNAVAIPSAVGDPINTIRFKIENDLWFKFPDGTFYLWNGVSWKKQSNPFPNISGKLSTYGSHCGLEQSVMMQGLMRTNASIVRYDYFITKALSTLDGGLYYKFAGIEKNPGNGKTAQQAFLESLGADETTIQQLRSDQRVAMFRSNVTGKPRRIEAFQGSGVRPGSGTGLITITYDPADQNVDQSADPIRNLLDLKDDAREVIAEKPNGLHIFALFAGDGSLQDSAPDNIVKDHIVPAPHTARLQSAISCIRCHGPFDGLQPFENDVKKMVMGSLDIFGDTKSSKSIPETLDRLAGLYAGDLTKPINRSKDDYSAAVFIATNGMSIPAVSAAVSEIYADYNYKLIDASAACRELGFDVAESKATKLLSTIVPPMQRDELGISPEDPIIAALKVGLKINRYQWEQIYPDIALRSKSVIKQHNTTKKFDFLNSK